MSSVIPPEISTDRGFTIVALGPVYEQLDETRLDQVKDSLMAAVEKANPPKVIIDLSHTKFFGSSFIEVLFRMWNRMHTRPDGRFGIVGLSPYCAEVLKITHLDSLWKTFPTREEAIKGLS